MTNAAHGESLQHPVYQSPFKVEPQFEMSRTPENYRNRHLGKDKLPEKMKTWKVQSTEHGNVVCRAYGFEDSPDAEVIALGFNFGKEYGAVGIGRHGNVLQWGYCDPPSRMTEAGKKLFLNCICYIHRFDGRRPLVHRSSSHRLNAIRLALLIDRIKDKKFFSHTFAPKLMAKYEGDPDGLADYYRQNLDLVYRARTFCVDSELKNLGLTSNRSVETLARLIELLGETEKSDTARQLLARYTNESFASQEQWQRWFDENKSRIFFSDVGGYKFFVRPADYPVGHKNQTKIGRALYR
jgi:hypothetical protein